MELAAVRGLGRRPCFHRISTSETWPPIREWQKLSVETGSLLRRNSGRRRRILGRRCSALLACGSNETPNDPRPGAGKWTMIVCRGKELLRTCALSCLTYNAMSLCGLSCVLQCVSCRTNFNSNCRALLTPPSITHLQRLASVDCVNPESVSFNAM